MIVGSSQLKVRKNYKCYHSYPTLHSERFITIEHGMTSLCTGVSSVMYFILEIIPKPLVQPKCISACVCVYCNVSLVSEA